MDLLKATDLLASSIGRRDDNPNQELAKEIIRLKQYDWVKELVGNLNHKDKNIQSDSIKVLYEIGERGAANMISPYCFEFGEVLTSKNNRMVWGAMTALDMIASVYPKGVRDLLPTIARAIDKGSVITIDHGVGILAKLASIEQYADSAFPLLIEQLKRCPIKQLPTYIEKSEMAINEHNHNLFINLIHSRLPEVDNDSQKTKLNKALNRLRRFM